MKWITCLGVLVGGMMVVGPVQALEAREYKLEIDNYRVLYSDFESKKETFQTFHTVKAEEEMTVAAIKMLIARDEVWISFFKYHQDILTKFTRADASTRLSLQSRLDNEIKFFIDHLNKTTKVKLRKEALKQAELVNQKNRDLVALVNQVQYFETLAVYEQALSQLDQTITAVMAMVEKQYFEMGVREAKLRGLQVIQDELQVVESLLSEPKLLAKTTNNINELDRLNAEINNKIKPANEYLSQEYQRFLEVVEGVSW